MTEESNNINGNRNPMISTTNPSTTTTTGGSIQDTPPNDNVSSQTNNQQQQSSVVFPSALVGSIVGTRSESGTMTHLKVTGSFDMTGDTTTINNNNNAMGRSRSFTAPSILSQEGEVPVLMSPATTVTTNTSAMGSSATSGSTDETHEGGSNNTTAAANNTSLNQTSSYVVDDDDDEEIRLAMAMALAIQNNPHLTPTEIHELLGSTTQQAQVPALLLPKQQQQQHPSKTFTPSTAASLFSSLTTASSSSDAAAAAAAKPSTNRFTQMFSSFATTTTAAAVATTPTTNTTNNSITTSNDSNKDTTATTSNVTKTTSATTTTSKTGSSIVAPTLTTVEEKSNSGTKSIVTSNNNNKPHPSSSTTTNTTNITNDAKTLPVTISTSNSRDLTVSTATAATTEASSLILPTKVIEPVSIIATTSTTTTTNVNKTDVIGSGLITTMTPTTSSSATAVVTAAHPSTMTTTTISPSFTKQISQRSAMLFKSSSVKNNINNPSQSGSVVTALSKPSVRISGVAWKRRGGMGKYSTSHAWERRRFELIGTKLFYYIIDENDDSSINPTTHDETRSVTDHHAGADTPTSSGITSSRKGHWLEGTGMNFTTSITSLTTDASNKEPRGNLDLAKEKATVHAAFGHSGAPTPFALSIKVRSETKWKLCFDRHATQMDWLVAISDVVIQCSVDAYNGYLLEAADPGNHTDFTMFHPPTIKDGPTITKSTPNTTVPTSTTTAIMGSSTQHRLWMLEDYKVTNMMENSDVTNDEGFPKLSLTDDKSKEPDRSNQVDDDNVFLTESSSTGEEAARSKDLMNAEVVSTQLYETTTAIDNDMIQDTILDESNQHWILPQEKLPYVLLIVNIALFYTRASSTPISGFWTMVVCTNFGILLCFGKEPTWQSLVDLINSVPTTTTTTRRSAVNTATVTNRSAPMTVPAIANDAPADSSQKINNVNPISDSFVGNSSDYIPDAGCTTVRLNNPSDIPQNAKGEVFAGWCEVPGEILAIRSHGYALTKKKVPSPGELYECIHLEVFESPHRYPDMAKRVKLPKVEFDDDVKLKTWRCPDLFIISIALPTDPPRMGKTSSDGGGYTITMYYRMKPETREILRRVTADGYDPSTEIISEVDVQKSKVNAVRLLEEWIRRAPTDHKFQSRFKIVPNAHNLKEIGMPAWISKYNGKPFLIKRPGITGFLYAHPELSCVEFDVSLHPFPYLAKQAICFMKESYFKKVLVSFGFVIEGRSDDELPECLIGLVQLCYPDPQYAIQATDFFHGTAQRSF